MDFLKALTEVSVAVHAPPTTTKYVAESELQKGVADALRVYGIMVRPNSPVRLDVTVFQKDTQSHKEDDPSDTQDLHDVVLKLAFTTRGVVRRGTKLYPIVASSVQVEGVNTVFQGNSIRRAFFGDETRTDMQELFPRMLNDILASLAQNDIVDPTPWYAAQWPDSQKAAADAEFAALMRAPIPAAGHFATLDVLPTISVTSSGTGEADGCRLPARSADLWRAAFRAMGWTRTSTDATLLFENQFRCDAMDSVNAPKYSRIWNSIMLKEPNFVFVLNGRIVRKLAVIHSANHLLVAQGAGGVADAIDLVLKEMGVDLLDLRIPTKARTAGNEPGH